MQPGICITVEPGIYFIDYQLDNALTNPELSKYIVKEKINEYRGFGAIRIEDNVVITDTGCEVLPCPPKTVEEIEALIEPFISN
jgi:Xaa-Pro dipeptidase